MVASSTVRTEEHARSWYAATANRQTNYPALKGRVKADVCIVGGGFSGVGTALALAEKGYRVVVLAGELDWLNQQGDTHRLRLLKSSELS